MRDHRLTVAEWLLDAGAGRSAVHVLSDLLGQRANELRRLALGSSLRPATVYALVALDDARGCAVPLNPGPGRSRATDPELRGACDRALALARRLLGAPNLPALRFEFEEWLGIFGASVGLPALLAFLGYYAPSRLPGVAILATGRLVDGGGVEKVGGMSAKRAIAAAEAGDKRVLLPEQTGRAEEAVSRVFGPEPLAPEAHVLTLDETIQRARADPDRQRSIALLDALPFDTFCPSDRVRILLELGTLHRHAGKSDLAERMHEEARGLLESERRFLGGDAAERYELECWLSSMDAFRIEEAIDALRSRLTAPFLSAHNEVRCRGMLAQALGMAGRHVEAVATRAPNVELQTRSEALRAVLPGTYCYLTLDSAKAGDDAGFTRWAETLFEATRPGDETQWRFAAAAAIRGLVALNRNDEALEWAYDRRLLFGRRVPAGVVQAVGGVEAVSSHPETSILRAVARAHRRRGEAAEALAFAQRVPVETEDLLGWLCALVHLEAELAGEESGAAGAASRLMEMQRRLTSLHEAATSFHRELSTTRGAALEAAIDRVWY